MSQHRRQWRTAADEGRRHAYPVRGGPGIAFSRISRECVARISQVRPDGSHLRSTLSRIPRRYLSGGAEFPYSIEIVRIADGRRRVIDVSWRATAGV
jgi:hypothetical protein